MVKQIVVVGSGVMGRGIAYVAAVGRFSTTVYDTKQEALVNAEKELNQIFDKALNRGKLTAIQIEEAKNRLIFSSSLEETTSLGLFRRKNIESC